jgi:hypothetical protein
MKSRFPYITLGAASLSVLTASTAKGPSIVLPRNDVTLLTGPYILSPASRPLASPSISSESLPEHWTNAEAARKSAQQKRAAIEARLQQLRAERDAALTRLRELRQLSFPTVPDASPFADPIRFDAKLPRTPVQLVPKRASQMPSAPR